MSKKIRLFILFFCAVCFFGAAPVLVAYSMGYRFDFNTLKVKATGGIYVRTFPVAESITIDSKIITKPWIFSNATFVQSLLPKTHTVSVKKTGYHDYYKTLPVKENQVTKLENVFLIKKSLAYTSIADAVSYFSIAPDNQNIITAGLGTNSINLNYFNLNNPNSLKKIPIPETGKILEIKWSENSNKSLIKIQNAGTVFYYYLDSAEQTPVATRLPYLDKNSQQINFNPSNNLEIFYVENQILYSLENGKPSAVLKNIVSYKIHNGSILWIPSQGAPNKSDITGKNTTAMAKSVLNPDYFNYADYRIETVGDKIFFINPDSLLAYDSASDSIGEIYIDLKNYKMLVSPDGKNMIYYNDNKIYLFPDGTKKYEELFSGSKINGLQWLNNDYIIFTTGNNVKISEIDYRGNINIVTLPSSANIAPGEVIQINNPAIFFIRHSGILYLLTGNSLLASEKITP
ncbi:MAG: PEGA domain-containing protein [Candidatus Staskawiczbacteria bacterium]|nr:PEGA domain-containing protein [Candidatus Staskawiczbacteria bacterium]